MLKLSDSELENEAQKLKLFYSNDLEEDFVSEVRLFRREFRSEVIKSESIKEILGLILSCDILSSMLELGRACILFCTFPVTDASAERSFSKLKHIKSYLRALIAQDRLDSLALISIENETARNFDLHELVDRFVCAKTRKKII